MDPVENMQSEDQGEIWKVEFTLNEECYHIDDMN